MLGVIAQSGVFASRALQGRLVVLCHVHASLQFWQPSADTGAKDGYLP